MKIFIQWESSIPILLEQVGGDMNIEEIMKFVTDRYCNKTRVQSVSLMNGSWLVKIVELEKLK